LSGRDKFEDRGVDGVIVLKLMFKEHGGRATFLSMRTPSGLENFADLPHGNSFTSGLR
jgi:hypothetical protein